jgi:galactonate dehydratase
VKLASVEAIPVRLARDLDAARGTAGTPTATSGEGLYRWSKDYPVLYATHIETALVRIVSDGGVVAWGEAQAPLAPEVACTIVNRLLAPVLVGETFTGTREQIAVLWQRMYSTMRVRGQTGGFMLDAIAGVDLALWDLAGKMRGLPVSQLLSANPKPRVPAYLSGLAGSSPAARVDFAARHHAAGFRQFKIYLESDWDALMDLIDALRQRLGDVDAAVDALWHLDPARAVEQAHKLDARRGMWLECPLLPEDVDGHIALARAMQTPLAIGESYRTRFELAPFFKAEAVGVVQPDLGRCGLTESMHIAGLAPKVVPHLSIAMGPQVAAAIHFAAAAENCHLCEYNPAVLETANRFLKTPLRLEGAEWITPTAPGLGVDLDAGLLAACNLA